MNTTVNLLRRTQYTDPNQESLFHTKAGPEEREEWLASALEIVNTRNSWWPSELYAVLGRYPHNPNWRGALFHQMSACGWHKIWEEHRPSLTDTANGRTEHLWRKAV